MRVFVAGILFGAMVAVLTGFTPQEETTKENSEQAQEAPTIKIAERGPLGPARHESQPKPSFSAEDSEASSFSAAKSLAVKLAAIRREAKSFELDSGLYEWDEISEESATEQGRAVEKVESLKAPVSYFGEIEYPAGDRTVRVQVFLTDKPEVKGREEPLEFSIYFFAEDGTHEFFQHRSTKYRNVFYRQGRFKTDFLLFKNLEAADMGDMVHLALPDPLAGTRGELKVLWQKGEAIERNFEWRTVKDEAEAVKLYDFFEDKSLAYFRRQRAVYKAQGLEY